MGFANWFSSDYYWFASKKLAKREKLLTEMGQVVFWRALPDLMERCCLKTSKKEDAVPIH